MSETKFTDGSSMEFTEDGEFSGASGKTAISVYALITAVSFLKLEMKTGMRMSRHMTALQGAENISGMKFGRGNSGRAKALAWCEAELARIKADEIVS
jgi:hypothetical protein